MTARTVLVTGASRGFGAMTVRELALAGHTVRVGMRATTDRDAPAVADLDQYATENGISLRAVELDVSDQDSVDAGGGQGPR